MVTAGLEDAMTYIDNVAVHSPLWFEHVFHIGQLFDRLEAAGLILNIERTSHLCWSSGGMRVSDAKT